MTTRCTIYANELFKTNLIWLLNSWDGWYKYGLVLGESYIMIVPFHSPAKNLNVRAAIAFGSYWIYAQNNEIIDLFTVYVYQNPSRLPNSAV